MKYALLIYGAPGASEHAAPTAGVITDWLAYTRAVKESGALLAAEQLTPSPVVEINRAVAVGMADGPRAGLAILEPVLAAGTLAGYAPLHAAHADLLERLGDQDEAAAAWARAAQAEGNATLQRELRRRRDEA